MKRWLVQLLVLPFLFSIGAPAQAATTTVTLAWDANTEPDLAGYRLYEASTCAGTFALLVSVGKVTQTTLLGVTDGSHCWRLTAFDASGNESGPSNTVALTLDTIPPSAPGNLGISLTVKVP
jgi:hypothetical protein